MLYRNRMKQRSWAGLAALAWPALALLNCVSTEDLAAPNSPANEPATERGAAGQPAQARQPAEPEPPPPPLHGDEGLPMGSTGSGLRLIRKSDMMPAPGDTTGQFRTTCVFSHMRRDPPQGQESAEGAAKPVLRAFFGNTSADLESTAESLRSGGNSTCHGGIVDRTSYWVPALLGADGMPLAPKPAQIYFTSGYEQVPAMDIKPFGTGLHVLAGDPNATQETLLAEAHWGCEKQPGERFTTIPPCEAGDHLNMVIEFPQCWNGRSSDSKDHRGHVAAPVAGQCPSSHPVPIPAVTLNVPYDVPAGGTAGMRLDSDPEGTTTPGATAHGVWFDAWEPDLVSVWVTNCINQQLDCHSHLLGDGRETYFTTKDELADQ